MVNMDDFESKQKPTPEQYLAANEEQLVRRMNNNPGGNQSEFYFIQTLLAWRVNKKPADATDNLVKVTWILVVCTGMMALIAFVTTLATHYAK